jgi:hypothetical protein
MNKIKQIFQKIEEYLTKFKCLITKWFVLLRVKMYDKLMYPDPFFFKLVELRLMNRDILCSIIYSELALL